MIYIAGDKFGYPVVKWVSEYLTDKHILFENLAVSDSQSDEKLEIFLPKVASNVLSSADNMGIVSCGTGVGVEVGINKFKGIRACLANEPKIAKWARIYDKCNVLCIPGWETTKNQVFLILDEWFSNTYDGDSGRLNMFKTFDSWK